MYPRVVSDFRREVDKICALLEFYSAYGGNSLPTFFFDFLTFDDETDKFYRKVGKEMPSYTA